MVTFPCMNGLLHVVHSYCLTKVVFAAPFHRLAGKKVVFPFDVNSHRRADPGRREQLKREHEVQPEALPRAPSRSASRRT